MSSHKEKHGRRLNTLLTTQGKSFHLVQDKLERPLKLPLEKTAVFLWQSRSCFVLIQGVDGQEYTLIKMKVKEPFPAKLRWRLSSQTRMKSGYMQRVRFKRKWKVEGRSFKGKGKEERRERRNGNWKWSFGRNRKKLQTPQPGIEPGTPANAADALPVSHQDKRHHQPVSVAQW